MLGSPGFGVVIQCKEQRSEYPHSGHAHVGVLCSIADCVAQKALSLNAKPEAGIVAEIGLGFVLLRANQTEGYVLGAGKFVHLIGLNRSRLLVSTTLCEQKFRHCAMGCFRLIGPENMAGVLQNHQFRAGDALRKHSPVCGRD
jgi:hypothetical protein